MAKVNNTILNDHAKRFIGEVMKKQLVDRGFVPKNDRELHWYRLVDNNVLQGIVFYTPWAAMPILMSIGYSCHPLFLVPEYPTNLHIPSMMRSDEVLNPGRPIFQQMNRAKYAPDIAVTCPDNPNFGAEILADILSNMETVHNVEECYQRHKRQRLLVAELLDVPASTVWRNISSDFMSEIVFMNDEELLPYCEERITRELLRYEKAQTVRKLWNIEKADLEALQYLKTAVIEGKREEYDIDYQHQDDGTHVFPHVHPWKGSVRSKTPIPFDEFFAIN